MFIILFIYLRVILNIILYNIYIHIYFMDKKYQNKFFIINLFIRKFVNALVQIYRLIFLNFSECFFLFQGA